MTELRLALSLLICAAVLAGCAGAGGVGGVKATTKAAPDIKVTLVSGGEATLSSFKGRPVVLCFGASWCPHCLHEMPNLQQVHEKYKDDVVILLVLSKSPEDEVRSIVEKKGLTFPVGMDPDSEAKKAYGVTGIPMSFFIDRQGNIRDDYFGSLEPSTLTDKIEDLLHGPM